MTSSFWKKLRQTGARSLHSKISNGLRALRLKRADRLADGDAPLHGYPERRVQIKFIEPLSDGDLMSLNGLLPWKCFTVDSRGRRFGRPAGAGKRNRPQEVPDRRILLMNERMGLRDKSVLEIGCFEGVHTLGLAMQGAHVVAVDARIDNVVKAIVRTALFGQRALIFKCDVEDARDWELLPAVDLAHHVGVLYHLKDPARHLIQLGSIVRSGLMLDTHYAHPQETTESYRVLDLDVPYKRYIEGGITESFSGMYDHAKWLTLASLRSLLGKAGFAHVDIVEEREEKNGPRVLLFAQKAVGT